MRPRRGKSTSGEDADAEEPAKSESTRFLGRYRGGVYRYAVGLPGPDRADDVAAGAFGAA
ncbi:hypothetical protein [Nocardiopsis sp. RV163]|uniref:hypothetical protein n=1 Tax=Nocardiopsis sp. RV163 TaxID=1661388 RepID=UPI00064C27AD|nr:hypothetical protein [Nocardiopsis sp. RV163]